MLSRSLQWERGLKFLTRSAFPTSESRSLQWERGLKYIPSGPQASGIPSFPAMGTWIEIPS